MSRRFFDSNGNELGSNSAPVGELTPICEVGGAFDETSVTLSVYSPKLDRAEVTNLLGTDPTKAWNPGEKHAIGNGSSGRTRIDDYGKWWLKIASSRALVEPKIGELLGRCTADLESWHYLVSKYQVWLTIAAHLDNWNRELDLSPETLRMLSERKLQLKVDVYFDGESDE